MQNGEIERLWWPSSQMTVSFQSKLVRPQWPADVVTNQNVHSHVRKPPAN